MTGYSNSDITVPDMFILYSVFFYHILYQINSDILKNTLNYLCCFISFFKLTICYEINFHVFILYLASSENSTGTNIWARFSFFFFCSSSRIRVTLCQETVPPSGAEPPLSHGFL